VTKTFDLKLLREALLIQCRFEDVQRVKPLVSGRRSGIVLTGRDSTALRAVAHDRDAPELILADASAYSGKKRSTATDPFDETWLQEQRSLGLSAFALCCELGGGDRSRRRWDVIVT